MEVECNECTSKLFVDMIKSICKISEQVKSFINPEQIKAIAESNEPILLLSNNEKIMRYVCVFICFLLWLIFTLLLSFTVIGLVISVSDEWQEMGDKIIDKL